MAIKHFSFDPLLTDSFVRLGYNLYRGDSHWIPPGEKELFAQFSPQFPFYQKPGNSHRHFLATTGGTEVGRVSALVNRDLRDKDGTPVGTIGFFECVNDSAVAGDLMDSAIHWLRDEHGIRRIWGPMNFDIWHSYRLMTRGFEDSPFSGEPYNKPYYQALFEGYGFAARHHWHSIEITGRDALDKTIAPVASSYQKLIDRGYRFEPTGRGKLKDNLRKFYSLVTSSFSENLGFTPISFTEFEQLCTASWRAFHPRLLTFVYNGNNDLVGFSGAFLDLSEVIRGKSGTHGLLAKLKFFTSRGTTNRILFYLCGSVSNDTTKKADFGRAVFYNTIRNILNEGYETVMIALMSRAGAMARLAGGHIIAPQRQYTLYELNV